MFLFFALAHSIIMLSEIQEKIGLTVTQLYIVALVFVLASVSTHSLISYFRSGLRLLPGPFLARFSPLWCTYINVKGDTHREYQRLHKKYGPVVRTGPNTVSIGDEANIPEIYQQGHSYVKVSSKPAQLQCAKDEALTEAPSRTI